MFVSSQILVATALTECRLFTLCATFFAISTKTRIILIATSTYSTIIKPHGLIILCCSNNWCNIIAVVGKSNYASGEIHHAILPTIMPSVLYAWLSLLNLTHWGRVTHTCVNKLTISGSDNGSSPGRRQAIIWINARILLIGPLGTNFSEILIEI